MKKGSLKQRFTLISSLILIAVMSTSAVLVDIIYREEVSYSAYERLRIHIFSLLSVTAIEDGELQLPYILSNPGFNRLGSGIWAAVLDEDNRVIWQSLSIKEVPEISLMPLQVGEWLSTKLKVDGGKYLVQHYRIGWQQNGEVVPYRYIVAEDNSVIKASINSFEWRVYGGVFLVSFILLILQIFGLRQAFRPIKRLQQDIARLEAGHLDKLPGDYPDELQGCTDNLNRLLENEHKQKERYRRSMADLAHSLKTPLSAIKIEIDSIKTNPTLITSLNKIDEIIEYHLRRAVITGHQVVKPSTKIHSVLGDIVDALNKVYRDKEVEVVSHLQPNVRFRGDQNDLFEILGNLLDNAYKFCGKLVQIKIHEVGETLNILIEDDGEGLEGDQADVIFDRGKQLDQKGVGQGIGLAVVHDIVTQYDGRIRAFKSSLGGAAFHLQFSA